MTLFVRLRGPQVTLQRRKRGCSSIICPKIRRWGLVPSLSLLFLSIAIASLGFFVITEVGVSQKSQPENRLLTRLRHSPHVQSHSLSQQGDYFKINPLLNRNAPNVQLSAQIILNSGYFVNIKRDLLKYHNSIKCGRQPRLGRYGNATTKAYPSAVEKVCENFTLVEQTASRENWWSMKSCPAYPEGLVGPTVVLPKVVIPITSVDITSRNGIRLGGWWEPRECISRHSIAIIIPYKDRWRHLTTLLNYLYPVLKRQQIRHRIYVVEQFGNETFNKGSIMNAGFIEAMKDDIYHCFVFHDVDLIPENDENMYSCPQMPRHLSVAVNELNYMLPYPELVGGVLAIRPEHYFKVNGYSNFFWGWGGEDDDMAYRLFQSGLFITRPPSQVGRYTMMRHKKRKPSNSKIRMRLLATSRKRYRLEGLNSVQYKLVQKKEYPWFTSILVDVGKPHPSFRVYQNYGAAIFICETGLPMQIHFADRPEYTPVAHIIQFLCWKTTKKHRAGVQSVCGEITRVHDSDYAEESSPVRKFPGFGKRIELFGSV